MRELVFVVAYDRKIAKDWADQHIKCHERLPVYVGVSTDIDLHALSGIRWATIILVDTEIPPYLKYKFDRNTVINVSN